MTTKSKAKKMKPKGMTDALQGGAKVEPSDKPPGDVVETSHDIVT